MKKLTIEQAKQHIGCYVQYNGEILTLEGVSYPNNSHNINYEGVLLMDEQGFADHGTDGWVNIKDIKLLLHPLSDLTKEIEHKGKKIWNPEHQINILIGKDENYGDITISYYKGKILFEIESDDYTSVEFVNFDVVKIVMKKLFEWHFDVQGLIPEGAIDINKLANDIKEFDPSYWVK